MTTVVHVRKDSYDVYIGRGSKWGNPYRIGIDGDRAEVIKKYAVYLVGKPELIASLYELKDKVLGCYCKPLECHGDILADLANDGEVLIEQANKLKKEV